MKLLVAGGAGFIGSNFIRYELETHPDRRIINFDKLTYAGNLENLTDLETDDRYEFVRGDICDSRVLDGLEFDVIVNFAAESHVDRSILDAQPFLNTNIFGTYTLLETALERNCLYLHVSTDEVYGSIDEGLFTEDSPLAPNSPYAASKASSDLMVRAYVKTHGLRAVVTRCSNNYGPYQFPEKLIPLVIVNALAGKKIPVYGDGMNIRDWIFVTDHCRALDSLLTKGTPGEVYNIGSRNERNNLDVVRNILGTLARETGRDTDELMSLITHVEDRKGHDRRYAIDPSKIETQTGWKPVTDFEEGLSLTVRWYLENRNWWERVMSGDYMKYYELQYAGRLKD
jgi:dTDP-glucose 4,6-dehydratase